MTQVARTNIPAIVGTLRINESALANRRPCIPAREVRTGDTLFAYGFRSGSSRIVHETLIADRALYVRTVDGWYRWTRPYAHVAAF